MSTPPMTGAVAGVITVTAVMVLATWTLRSGG